jgi:hypothetical protein
VWRLSCHSTGLGPEYWGFIDSDNESHVPHKYGPNSRQRQYHSQHGFFLMSGYDNTYTICDNDLLITSPTPVFFSGESYQLRPEVIEVFPYSLVKHAENPQLIQHLALQSNFYAWRATGDLKYQRNAIKMMNSIVNIVKPLSGMLPSLTSIGLIL